MYQLTKTAMTIVETFGFRNRIIIVTSDAQKICIRIKMDIRVCKIVKRKRFQLPTVWKKCIQINAELEKNYLKKLKNKWYVNIRIIKKAKIFEKKLIILRPLNIRTCGYFDTSPIFTIFARVTCFHVVFIGKCLCRK